MHRLHAQLESVNLGKTKVFAKFYESKVILGVQLSKLFVDKLVGLVLVPDTIKIRVQYEYHASLLHIILTKHLIDHSLGLPVD